MLLGSVGFLCGYFGPLALSPEANQGPLLGIFITGPLAFAFGIVFGVIAAALNIRNSTFIALLALCAVLTASITLYLSLPEDRFQGYVVDAEIRGCQSPERYVAAAEARWDTWNAETTWRSPRQHWKNDIPRMLERDKGVVLSLLTHRRWDIYEQRKPWNRGRLRVTQSAPRRESENYFARAPDRSCSDFRIGDRRIYAPEWEASAVSPPDILPTFLGLYVLEDVPQKFRPLVRR